MPGDSSENVNSPSSLPELAVVARPRLLELLRCASSSFCLKKAVP